MFQKGDLVKRCDDVGCGTGIIYRIAFIGEPDRFYIKRHGRFTWVNSRRVKLSPALVMFEAKHVSSRNTVGHLECELEPLDIVSLGAEYARLGLFIEAEVKARAATGGPSD